MNDAYEILSGKTKVAVWRDERLTVLNPDLLPLYPKMNQNLKAWLTTRAADNRRPHIRLLKKALRLTDRDDISTVIHVNGATITDNYWIRPLGSDLTYDDVRFTDDYFSNLALKGNYDSFNRAASSKRSKTPELTNIGSFGKCWKLRDGQWWMFKRATHDEMFSELLDGMGSSKSELIKLSQPRKGKREFLYLSLRFIENAKHVSPPFLRFTIIR